MTGYRTRAATPPLTYAGLTEYAHGGTRWIGTTVEIPPQSDQGGSFVTLSLHGVPVARISAEHVQFLGTIRDAHPGVKGWAAQIAVDNELATSVLQVDGVLCLDGNRQRAIAGETYGVGSWGNKRTRNEGLTDGYMV